MCTEADVRRSTKVLIVEEDAHIALGISVNLEYAGFDVQVSRNGDCALKRAIAEAPAIVLLDISRRSGCEWLRKFREHQLDTRVIFLSTNPNDRNRCCAQEADAFITKPFALRDLLARVVEQA